jgi:hypothetical protein
MGLFPFTRKNNYIGILDISGDKVSASLVFIGPKNTLPCVQVKFTTHTPIVYGNPASLKRYLKSISDGIDQVLAKTVKDQSIIPDRWFCFLPSILTNNKTTTLTYEDEKEFIVTTKMVQGMVSKQAKDWLDSNNTLYTDLPTDQNILLESHILEIKLNGYKVIDYPKKKATKLELEVYTSASSKQILDMIKNKMANYTHGRDIFLATSVLSQYQTLAEIMPDETDYLLIDPSGELCDVLFVSGGVFKDHVSFPLGKNILTRSNQLDDIGFNDRFSTLRLYAENKLTKSEVGKLEQKLSELEKSWQKLFSHSLKHLAENGFIPNKVFILADDPVAKIFAMWINKIGFEEYNLARKPLTANLLTPATLANFCDLSATKKEDLTLAFGALFARRFVQ